MRNLVRQVMAEDSIRKQVQLVMAEYSGEDLLDIYDSSLKTTVEATSDLLSEINQTINKTNKDSPSKEIALAQALKKLVNDATADLAALMKFFSVKMASAELDDILHETLPKTLKNLQKIVEVLEKKIDDKEMPEKWKKNFDTIYFSLNKHVELLFKSVANVQNNSKRPVAP
jgi:hypothetical protein